MAMFHGFTHWTWWFSIAMLNHQRLPQSRCWLNIYLYRSSNDPLMFMIDANMFRHARINSSVVEDPWFWWLQFGVVETTVWNILNINWYQYQDRGLRSGVSTSDAPLMRTQPFWLTILYQCQVFMVKSLSGWWFQPFWKILVNWDD